MQNIVFHFVFLPGFCPSLDGFIILRYSSNVNREYTLFQKIFDFPLRRGKIAGIYATMRVDGSNLPPLSSFVGKCTNNLPSSSARVRGGNNGGICLQRLHEAQQVRPVGKAVNPQDTRLPRVYASNRRMSRKMVPVFLIE